MVNFLSSSKKKSTYKVDISITTYMYVGLILRQLTFRPEETRVRYLQLAKGGVSAVFVIFEIRRI